MKNNFKKNVLRLIALCLTLAFLVSITITVSGTPRYFEGEAESYFNSLIVEGFPEDYASLLTELHLLHPNWSFTPLLITEHNSQYTWDYIIERENHDPTNPENNLIYSTASYNAYHHPTNKVLYDSSYYQVSDEGLKYFMDPRNFLNETDIFQFFDLSSADGVTETAVQAILYGTFMESMLLENGQSFAEYFVEVGKELSINPIYLAVKARQEQGVAGTSPLISGNCGSVLADFYENNTQKTESGLQVLAPSEGYSIDELRAFDGYYNVYNISASGNGLFNIYHKAMTRAQSGTDAMADEWGSPAWNTLWKSIYGGASVIKHNYIDSYQNTIYLQKFNVDSRASSQNFWKQYMQNVTGAISEGRTLYTSFAAMDALDSECSFLIPVYGGMPSAISHDPANGTCSASRKATDRYHYSVLLTSPLLANTANAATYHTKEIHPGDLLQINGSISHSYGVKALEYRWDNGEWIPFAGNGNLNLSLRVNFFAGSSHILSIRGVADYDNEQSTKKSNYHFLCAVFYVNVVAPPDIDVTLKNRSEETVLTYPSGTAFPLPSHKTDDFHGWIASDMSFLPAGTVTTVTEDITYDAFYLRFEKQDGAALVFSDDGARLRFFSAIDKSAYERLNALELSVELYATATANNHTTLITPTLRETITAFETEWIILYADTQAIVTEEDAQTEFSVDFYATLTYSNNVATTIKASAEPFSRSASAVAQSALNDGGAEYSDEINQKLMQLAAFA